MNRFCGYILLGCAVVLTLSARPVSAQTVGTYTYFWTNTAGTPITSISANTDSTFTVQLRIQEAGGGNAFVTGINAYDANVVWGLSGSSQSLFSFATTGVGTDENAHVRTNPYPTPANGFDGFGAVLNDSIAGINANRALDVTRDVLGPTNSNNWVKQSTVPNTAGTLLLMELTFTTTSNSGTTTVTGRQGTNPDNLNYLYFLNPSQPLDDSQYLYLDEEIGNANAVLTVTVVPIPEPATVLGVCAAALGFVGLVRRCRRKTTTNEYL